MRIIFLMAGDIKIRVVLEMKKGERKINNEFILNNTPYDESKSFAYKR